MNNIHKIIAIIFPTFIITSPVSALDCYLASSEVNVSNENLVKIPYEDGLKSLMPDSYACHDGCNVCNFKIKKFDSYYQVVGSSCTAKACGPGVYTKGYKLCIKNWILSDSVSYKDLPLSVKRCINGYKNITYIKKQQELDKNFSLEESKTSEHTRIALSEGIPACKKLFNFLKEKERFKEKEILYFSIYLGHRNFPNSDPEASYKTLFGGDIFKIQKKVFDYLSANYDEVNMLVTDEMLEEFEQHYQEYLTQKRANRLKKISQFWQKLLNFLKF